jgi:protein SYS1
MPPRRRRPPRPGALSDLPPHRILRTILLLQLSYYLTATILIGFSTLVLGQRFALNLILDWRSVRGDVTVGWLEGGCWVGASFLTCAPSSPFLASI